MLFDSSIIELRTLKREANSYKILEPKKVIYSFFLFDNSITELQTLKRGANSSDIEGKQNEIKTTTKTHEKTLSLTQAYGTTP